MKATGLLSQQSKKTNEFPEREGKQKHAKSWQDSHAEILKNIQSTNIGKPTQVEAQRILQIMDTLYQNLNIYMYLDVDFISKFLDLQKGRLPKDLVNQLSPVAKDLLIKQAEGEAKLKPLAQYLDVNQKGEDEEGIEEDKKLQAEQYQKMLETNFKNLLRYLKEHPQDFDIIKHMRPNPNPELSDLVHCIECQRIIFQKKLSTAHEEEESHKKQLIELKKRIENLNKKKTETEKDLKSSRADRENFQKENKEEQERLRGEIQMVKAEKRKKQQDLSKGKETLIKQLDKDHEEVKKDLNDKIQKLTDEFNKIKKENDVQEKKNKTNKNNQAGFLEENIRTYDSIMEEKMQEVGELKDELDKINKELSHLEDHFAKIEQERKRENELRNEIQKRKDEYETQNRRRNEAAKRIQNAYRGYKDNSKKKKKKKRGGGKK